MASDMSRQGLIECCLTKLGWIPLMIQSLTIFPANVLITTPSYFPVEIAIAENPDSNLRRCGFLIHPFWTKSRQPGQCPSRIILSSFSSKSLKLSDKALECAKKEVFGNLQQNIKLAEDKILCLQTAMETSSAYSILDYLTLAKAEMHNLLQAEELHWKQKSRIKWLTEGNRNTRFFHLSTKIKGNFNTIDRITVRNTTISDSTLIKSAAIQQSTTTFEAQPVQVHDFLFNCDHKRVYSDQNILLTAFSGPDEIMQAMFALGNLNSPGVDLGNLNSLGVDGFSGCFYTSCWDSIGDTVIATVQNFYSLGKLLKASASFLLSLISKCHNPSFNDFRLISLLNLLFKIITKILASRLSSILHTIVSPNQATFVKGKSIYDHLALAHELSQKLNRKLVGGSFRMKLDISKAFDKLNWSFLFASLHYFGLYDQWNNLVKECVCNSKGSVLLNREIAGFFSTHCGLRQGDPLSPYLFILAEEVLSWNIGKLVE